jgi:O-antigen/teichoic acid export membrane protein
MAAPDPNLPAGVSQDMLDIDVLDTAHAGPLALRGSILRSGAYGASILLSLVSAPLLIRHLGSNQYGHYIVVTALVAIVGGLSEGGVNAVALREYASTSGAERDRLMANLLGIRMVMSAAGVAGAVLFAALAGYGRVLVLGTLLAGVGMSLQVTQDLLGVSLQATLRFGWVTLVEFVRQFVGVALILALIVVGADLLGFFAITIAAGLVAVVLSVVLVRGLFPLRPVLRVQVASQLLSDTFVYAVAIALNSVYFRVTVVIMSLVASVSQTGYFAVSFRVVEVLIAIPALVMGAAYPILTRAQRDDQERFLHATRRMFELAVLMGAWVALALELGAGFIVEVLGGHSEAPAAAVLRIQGLAVAFTFVAVAGAYPMLSRNRRRDLVLANVAGLVAALLLSLVLIPAMAAKGAAIATVGAEAMLAVVVAVALVRSTPGLRLPLSILPVAALAAAVGGGVGYLVGVHPIVEIAVASCLYLAIVLLLGRFPPEFGHVLRRSSSQDSDRVMSP